MASSGNFATWNGVEIPAYLSLSQGNTKVLGNTSTDASGINLNIGVTSGKWYVEFYVILTTSNYPYIGLSAGPTSQDFAASNTGYNGDIRYHVPNSTGMNNNTGSAGISNQWGTITVTETGVDASSNGDVIGFALDMDNKKLFISRNGTFFNSGDPANGTNPQASWTTNPQNAYINCFSYTSSRGCIVNCGQDSTFSGAISAGGNADGNGFGDFKYSPPTGFLALCSANLTISDDIDPAQTDDDYPSKNFNAITWTGNRSSNSTVNNITGVGFQPDLVWLKFTEQSYDWRLVDSSRGVTKATRSNQSTVEHTEANGLYQFDSDGFSVKGDNNYNYNGGLFTGLCWKANGGTTASNSDGSITTTVQANQKAGFSIVTYTGNETSGATIGHGLGVVPKWIIVKNRDTDRNWACYHASDNANGTKALLLNTGASDTSNYWGGNQPTSSVLTLGGETEVNKSGDKIVAYFWADVEGYQKFGNYIGNGDSDGPFVYLGFRPSLLVLKRTTSSGFFNVFNSGRKTSNSDSNPYLVWNNEDVEANGVPIDFLSNGFKVRSSGSGVNSSGNTMIYMAWGDVPFKYNNTF